MCLHGRVLHVVADLWSPVKSTSPALAVFAVFVSEQKGPLFNILVRIPLIACDSSQCFVLLYIAIYMS